VVLAFSEPVALGATVLELACTSGPRTLARSGGPGSWTFDPATDFAPGDACTATVRAAQVTDLDGTPDAMAADVVFGFSVAPDLPPSVASTSPANNATNVGLASNLVVTFSEPVNAGTGAFELRCPPSGPLPFTLTPVAQTTYTLDPAADFDPLTACSLRVIAEQVSDLDGSIDLLPADVTIAFTTGQDAGDYYAGVDASSCQALRSSLHALIDDHTAYPYTASTTDTWDILEAADQDPLDPSRVLEIYENVPHAKAGGGNANYNREHTWPNAYGFNDLSGTDAQGRPVSAAYTDTHMLMLSDITYNSDRGSKPFADCPQASGCQVRATQAYNGVGGGLTTYPGQHNWVLSAGSENLGSFEVWSARKGDLARAILYMDLRYEGGSHGVTGLAEPDLIVTDDRALIATTPSGSFAATGYMGLRGTLLAWSAADPPTALEVLRNDVVQSFQGNRNPFIDHPDWVALAFAQPCTSGPPDAVFGNGFEP
jgi:endonuclease I